MRNILFAFLIIMCTTTSYAADKNPVTLKQLIGVDNTIFDFSYGEKSDLYINPRARKTKTARSASSRKYR